MPLEGEADFSQAILEEAQHEADEMVSLARREAERILDGARAEIDRLYLEEAPPEKKYRAQTRYNQVVAAAEFDAQRNLLLAQERYIADVQQRVSERLLHIRQDPRYAGMLRSLIHQGIAELEGEAFEVIVAPEDRERVNDELLGAIREDTGKSVTLAEESQEGMTGAIIQRTDRRVICNNTFQAIVQRQQSELRLLIAQELFGEKIEL